MTSLTLAMAPVPAVAATGGGSTVEQAQEDLDAAIGNREAIMDRLDQLASSYEDALAHTERLSQELDGAEETLEEARGEVVEAETAWHDQVRLAYKQPGADLFRESGAFLLAPDIGTALHASAVMAQAAAARAEMAADIRRAAERVSDNVENQRGIGAGTAAAMQDLRNLSGVFSDELEAAAAQVAAAEAALADAEELAEQQAWLQGYDTTFGYVPPPVIREVTLNGGVQLMTCPLGQPNGFIDSWGFPRSGGRTHQGVDMFASYGMPVLAAADGYIRRVYNNTLGGLSIDLVDSLGNRYYYAHLSAAYVTDFQTVQVGQLIAANGNSGNAISTPPHVHWQYHPGDGGPINPFPLAAALCR